MAIAGKVGAVFLQTEDAAVSFTKKTTASNPQRTRYTVIDEACRYFDKTANITVYINDVAVPSGWWVEYLGGVICFITPLDPEDEVTVSGKRIKVEQAGGFFNWSAELSSDTADITTFESDGWKENLPTIKGFSASAECYWADEKLSQRLGQEVILALYVDTSPSKKRYEGYAIISSDSIEVAVDDVINESIEFEGTDKLFYRED